MLLRLHLVRGRNGDRPFYAHIHRRSRVLRGARGKHLHSIYECNTEMCSASSLSPFDCWPMRRQTSCWPATPNSSVHTFDPQLHPNSDWEGVFWRDLWRWTYMTRKRNLALRGSRRPQGPNSAFLILVYSRITKLTKNWRSHEAILRFPSDQFYNGTLQACGSKESTECLSSCPFLGRQGFPVVFDNVEGMRGHGGSILSISWLLITDHEQEHCAKVRQYIDMLRGDQSRPIGTLSAYAYKHVCLRSSLRRRPRHRCSCIQLRTDQETTEIPWTKPRWRQIGLRVRVSRRGTCGAP